MNTINKSLLKINILLGIILFIFCLLSLRCQNDPAPNNRYTKHNVIKATPPKDYLTIDIIPFDNIPQVTVTQIFHNLKLICPNVTLKNAVSFPTNAYFRPRNRYKADSLIAFLSNITLKGHIALGLTDKDISTNNEERGVDDWGIMGLSYLPGNACVASTFRLDKNNLTDQFFKICIHELGHTQGLNHCPTSTCFMRDAEGKNPTDDEKEFCHNCKKYLITKGWSMK